MFEDIQTFLLIGGIILFALIGWPIIFYGAPFLPSFRNKDSIDFESLITVLKKNDVKDIIDLGSGDGRIISELSGTDFSVSGVEINPLLVWFSRLKLQSAGSDSHSVFWGNFWNIDLSQYDAVFMFHFKTANERLEKKCREELKDRAVIVSTGFELDNFDLIETISPFYVYVYNRE